MGKIPYEGKSRYEIKRQMEQRQAYIDNSKVKNYSNICIDFINSLLNKNPQKRLGSKNGISEIKNHPFFRMLNWDLIYHHNYFSPIYDIIKFSRIKEKNGEELFDKDFCNKKEHLNKTTLERFEKIKNRNNYSKYFKNYTFININNILKTLEINRKLGKYNNKNEDRLLTFNKNLKKSYSIDKYNKNQLFNSMNNCSIYNKNEQNSINNNIFQGNMYHSPSHDNYEKFKKNNCESIILPYIDNNIESYNKEKEKRYFNIQNSFKKKQINDKKSNYN